MEVAMKDVWLSVMFASAMTTVCACSGARDVEIGSGEDAVDAPAPTTSKDGKTPATPSEAQPTERDDARGAEAKPPAPAEPPSAAEDAGADRRNCSRSISCVNGACACGSGPLAGLPCDGTSTDRPTSCSVLCAICE
jgi:hypothetical protein